MNEQQMFDVGDLVYIVQDCYVFMSTRARIVKMGGIGIIIQICIISIIIINRKK